MRKKRYSKKIRNLMIMAMINDISIEEDFISNVSQDDFDKMI